METATILTPPSIGLSGILLPEANICEGLEYEKYQHYIAFCILMNSSFWFNKLGKVHCTYLGVSGYTFQNRLCFCL